VYLLVKVRVYSCPACKENLTFPSLIFPASPPSYFPQWKRVPRYSLHAGRGVKWTRRGWTSFHLHVFCPHPLRDNDKTQPTAFPSEGESDTARRVLPMQWIEDTQCIHRGYIYHL